MFRSYTDELKCNLRDKFDISESIDILTGEDMEKNRVPHAVSYEYYEWSIFQENTSVYIIKFRNKVCLDKMPFLVRIIFSFYKLSSTSCVIIDSVN